MTPAQVMANNCCNIIYVVATLDSVACLYRDKILIVHALLFKSHVSSTYCITRFERSCDAVMLNRFYNSASFVVSRYQVLQIHTEHPGKVTDLQEYLTDNGMEVVDLISNCNCKLVIILLLVINMHMHSEPGHCIGCTDDELGAFIIKMSECPYKT